MEDTKVVQIDYSLLYEDLRVLTMRLAISMEDIAETLGMSRGKLWRIGKGRGRLSASEYMAICYIMAVPATRYMLINPAMAGMVEGLEYKNEQRKEIYGTEN